jgi:hypothetical protein
MAKELTNGEFNEFIDKGLVLVDFYALVLRILTQISHF